MITAPATMENPAKAPAGQRLVAAFLALFCLLAVVAISGSAALVTWYGVPLVSAALCAACVFGHITARGRLPGHFRAGGNAFLGSRQNVRAMDAYRSAPVWQRVICGVLAAGGGVGIVASLAAGDDLGYQSVASLVVAAAGCCLFGHVALRGRLPSPRLAGGNAALHRRSRRDGR